MIARIFIALLAVAVLALGLVRLGELLGAAAVRDLMRAVSTGGMA